VETGPTSENLPEQPSLPKWRWAAGLSVLLLYVAGLGLLGSRQINPGDSTQPLLPDSIRGLLIVCGGELIFFSLVFGLFWILTRPTKADLRFNFANPVRIFRRGILYSIALRAFISVVMILTAILIAVVTHKTPQQLSQLRPRTENLVDFANLSNNPLYFLLTITVVSFVLGGFREELWRAGVLAACKHLLPASFPVKQGEFVAIVIAAIVFGLGHLPQGWGGVYVTGILGVALGWIMVRHGSIWEAALAHGFFDATTFALVYLLAKYFPSSLSGI